MLTIFSTPKPFRGLEKVIQYNAIKSWTLLHPDIEIILFGDEEGISDTVEEFGIRHEPEVQRSESSMKFLDPIFRQAQDTANHELVCYVNCDIILTSDFIEAAKRVSDWRKTFLMIGHRWDVDITQPWDYEQTNWEEKLQQVVLQSGKRHPSTGTDYFVFPRGSYEDVPPLVIGRVAWDNWLIWKARSSGIPVVDATPVVMAIHQNHDYSYHPDGKEGVWRDEEAQRNRELAGGAEHFFTLRDSTWLMTPRGLVPALTRQHLHRRWEVLPILHPHLRVPHTTVSLLWRALRAPHRVPSAIIRRIDRLRST